jgi:four helix bundle protein
VDVDVDVVVEVDVDVDEGGIGPLVHGLHPPGRMNYRSLDVYQKSVRFLPIAAQLADGLPPQYGGLADQVRRASLSVVQNIAEGSGKTSVADQRRFYAIARGSAMECAAIVDACLALKLADRSVADEADGLLTAVVQMLSKMCRG